MKVDPWLAERDRYRRRGRIAVGIADVKTICDQTAHDEWDEEARADEWMRCHVYDTQAVAHLDRSEVDRAFRTAVMSEMIHDRLFSEHLARRKAQTTHH